MVTTAQNACISKVAAKLVNINERYIIAKKTLFCLKFKKNQKNGMGIPEHTFQVNAFIGIIFLTVLRLQRI